MATATIANIQANFTLLADLFRSAPPYAKGKWAEGELILLHGFIKNLEDSR
jgi:hypothetical protein